MRISILKDSLGGQSAYTETHTPKTNQQGIVQLNIGAGTVVSGTFASVPWSSGKLFVKTEMDLQGGSNYSMTSTNQLLIVPYALYTSNVPVSKIGDTVTIGKSRLLIPGSQLLPGAAPASLSNGLMAYYPLNGNANDESGNSRNGTSNQINWGKDRSGNSNSTAEFNGVSGRYIRVNNVGSSSVSNFSFSYWIKINTPLSVYNHIITINGASGIYCQLYGPHPYYTANGVVGKLGFSGYLGS
jgi:hypothetical protein